MATESTRTAADLLRSGLLKRLVVAVAATVLFVLACHYAITHAGGWLDVGQLPERTDYVVVLPGDAERRPFVAAALINAGLAGKALIPSNLPGPDVIDGITLPAEEVIRQVLLARGVPESRIVVLPGESTNTADDLAIVFKYLSERPEASVAFVTSAIHTRRARWTIRRVMQQYRQFRGKVVMVSAPNPLFGAADWWRYPNGFLAVTTEYIKLFFYWCRYGLGCYWLAGAFAALFAFCAYRRLRIRRALGNPETTVRDGG
jgi:uncharacterized SAM-binding protein YcdF (DUF218 family)